ADEQDWSELLARDGGSADESVADLLLSTTTETVELIESHGPRVVILDSLPTTDGEDPLECLAGAQRLHECEVPLPERPVTDAVHKVAAARSDNVHTVDLTDLFCVGAPRCLPVVDDIVVWRDPHHFSREITMHRRGEVWERLQQTGALEG